MKRDTPVSAAEELAGLHDSLSVEPRPTEEAVNARELNFQLTVDSIPGMVHTMTATGGVEFVNREILDFFGKTLEELQNWETLLHPDDRARIVDSWAHAVATGEPFDVEHRVLRADGTYVWLHSRGLPLRDVAGKIVRWYHLLTDIDQRKRAEEALRESERDLRMIVNGMPGFVCLVGAAGDLQVASPQVLEYTGQTLDELKQWGTGAVVHRDDLPHVIEAFTQAIATDSPHDTTQRLRRFDGVYRWFRNRGGPIRDATGTITRWCFLFIDIDDQKRAEDANRANERNLQLIIDTIPALAWSARPDGTTDFFNRHYLEFVGLSAERAKDWGWMAAVHPEDLNGLTATWLRIMDSAYH